MNKENSWIFIIDDDDAIRRSISLLLYSSDYKVETFRDPEEFYGRDNYYGPGCILLDVFLKGKSGLELQEGIMKKFEHLPIIYITGFGDIPMSVQALKKGAVNFLQKPIDDRKLLDAVDEALNKSYMIIKEREERNHIRVLTDTLTPRESEIFRYIITGMLNKQIAARLNISEHTVKIHRGKITEKLGVKSVAELVQMAQKINLV